MKAKRKKVMAVIAAMLCLGAAAAASLANQDLSQKAADIPEHDGEVLVDSLNISEPGSKGNGNDSKDTALVTSDDISDLEHGDTYFREMRATINLDRNEMISMLTDVEATANTSAEKENATEQKTELLKNMQMEQDIENAIAAKGLPECLVLISENGVKVTVNKQELNDTDVAKICDIVMRETGRKASEIIVQSKF